MPVIKNLILPDEFYTLIIKTFQQMKNLVILGAGTAGTMMANHLQHELKHSEWQISIIDEREEHHYQPGYLFLPFDSSFQAEF